MELLIRIFEIDLFALLLDLNILMILSVANSHLHFYSLSNKSELWKIYNDKLHNKRNVQFSCLRTIYTQLQTTILFFSIWIETNKDLGLIANINHLAQISKIYWRINYNFICFSDITIFEKTYFFVYVILSVLFRYYVLTDFYCNSNIKMRNLTCNWVS